MNIKPSQGMTIPAKILSIRYFTYYIIFDILPVQYYCLDGTRKRARVRMRTHRVCSGERSP